MMRPNILWLSAEDISPTLGCYGDAYATTPNLDRLAAQGIRYDRAFTHAPVCAPSRSGIITGMYPNAIGTSWMRCQGRPPPEARCFPEYLRAAGYFCSNNCKTDYQFDPSPETWDINSREGHWRNRPDKDQPFFAVFNFTVTHEGNTRQWNPGWQIHNPDKAPLPPYYPDTPLVRQNVACYYDRMSELDAEVQRRLDELEADGLADSTIVWFWGDHGWGLTRGKRWVYDSGLRVPLLVRVPERFREWAGAGDAASVAPGAVETEFARFLDFAPTVLSLAGVPIPGPMQGRAFLGPQRGAPPELIHAARDRMDETVDCIRAMRDKQFKYIRNFMPHLSRAQHIDFMDRTPILKEMRRLHAEGRLQPGPQSQYFECPKPVHELYDTLADPHEVNNLAADPKYAAVLARMKAALDEKLKAIGDAGLVPEPDFEAMKADPAGEKRHWRKRLDQSDAVERILAVKQFDGCEGEHVESLLEALKDKAGPVRYWAVVGLHQASRKHGPNAETRAAVEPLLADESPSVAVAAAEALVDWGESRKGLARLLEALASKNEPMRLYAAWAIDRLGPKTGPILAQMEAALNEQPRYPGAVLKRTVERLKKND